MLDLAGYDPGKDLGGQTLIEPAVGAGAFLLLVIERLLESARRFGRSFEDLDQAIRAYDIQRGNIKICRDRVRETLLHAGCPIDTAGRLADAWLVEQDFLLAGDLLSGDVPDADYVVGNPPYIRIEDLAESMGAEYRRRWVTMAGRADIYVGFIERGLRLLKRSGRLVFICADRWMRNQYGAGLRGLVSSGFAVRDVWVMHDVDAFESQVSAYPAIVAMGREPQGPAVVIDTDARFGPQAAAPLTKWSLSGAGTASTGPGFDAHRLPGWFDGDDMWPSGSPERLSLIEHLTNHFPPLHDPATGTKVSIGVATGADQVFVVQGVPDVEPDRILRLSMTSDLRSGTFRWSGHHLVDPWGPDGRLVDLAEYPRLAAHLAGGNGAVRDRFVAKKYPASWFRTIDKVDHTLTGKPKLLLQDMRSEINPVLEPGGHYPHHNLYYVTSDKFDMEVLGGLLLSRVAQAFVEAYAVRMRGGTLRFQAQYLKKIRVPSPDSITPAVAERLRQAFRDRDRDGATRAAESAYGLPEGRW